MGKVEVSQSFDVVFHLFHYWFDIFLTIFWEIHSLFSIQPSSLLETVFKQMVILLLPPDETQKIETPITFFIFRHSL